MTAEMRDAAGAGRGQRMFRQRKRGAGLRGEDLETVSCALWVTAATLRGLSNAFLAAGEASLASRSRTGRR